MVKLEAVAPLLLLIDKLAQVFAPSEVIAKPAGMATGSFTVGTPAGDQLLDVDQAPEWTAV